MGIGNPPDPHRQQEALRLQFITPHGDRKPRSWEHAPCFHRSGFITPHGDRKLAFNLSGYGGYGGSLPLMGIGNPAPLRRRSRPPDRLHYPSWGSETRDHVSLLTVLVRQPQFITPHGDRKLGQRVNRSPRRSAVHYPSWGSETRVAPSAFSIARRSSLPLMGIGNPNRNHLTRNPSRFITPHGDRKPAVGAGSVCR